MKLEIQLTSEQRAQIELLSLYTGKSPADVLLEAAEHLLDRQAGITPSPQEFGAPPSFTREQVERRFARLLGKRD